MKDVTVVVSRNDYTSIMKDGELIDSLKNRNIVYILSSHSSIIPFDTNFEEIHIIELVGSESYLTSLIKSVSTRYNVTDIISTGEEELLPVAHARQQIGVSGVHVEQANLFRNKLDMKRKLTPTSVLTPKYSPALDIDSLYEMQSEFGRIIIKPQDGYSSNDITLISSKEELDLYLSDRGDVLDQFLAEEFIGLEMYHLDAIVLNGDILFSTLGKYDKPLFDYKKCQWMISKITNQMCLLHEESKRVLNDILKEFKSDTGVFHFEFFSDGASVIFCEIAIRPAGGTISDAIYETWGVHLHEVNVQLQLNMPFTLPETKDRHTSSILLMSQETGVIKEFMGEEFLNANDHIIRKRKKNGDVVIPSQFCTDSILNIVAVRDTKEQLDAAIQKITSKQYYRIANLSSV